LSIFYYIILLCYHFLLNHTILYSTLLIFNYNSTLLYAFATFQLLYYNFDLIILLLYRVFDNSLLLYYEYPAQLI